MPVRNDPDAWRLDPGLTALTRFIGREREVDEVHRLLASSRLLTLTGAGGSGKTRLAAEVLQRHLSDFAGRTVWVELASLADPALVPQRIAEALGVREDVRSEEPSSLVDLLGPAPVLLVLDNCEHLVDACAELADALLRASPDLRILATSREALGVKGERAWLVPPLSLPGAGASAEEMGASEAVQLFVDRARDTVAGFAVTPGNASAVAEICTRLDGIPLAIELAAARIRVLSPEQIKDRLDDAFRLLTSSGRGTVPRHRTLRAAIGWSYDLLAPDARLLLHRLSAFRGGFALDAAEAVGAGGILDEGDLLDALARLVDRSLVQVAEVEGSARYSLLETIRRYAGERLEESGEGEEVRARHAAWMVGLAEAAQPHIFGGQGDRGWLERLDLEGDNLRAAADWAEAMSERADFAARLATALQWYWFARGRFREGRARLERALARDELVASPVRARARVVLGNLRFWQGDLDDLGATMASAVEELRGADDPLWLLLALTGRGMAAHLEGDPEAARASLDEAVALARGLPEAVPTVFTLYWHGLAAQGRGELAVARASFEEGIRIGRSIGDQAASSHALTVMGRLLLAEGDLAGARDALAEGLAGHRARGDRWGMALTLEVIARIALADGRPEPVVRVLANADALRGTIDSALPGAEARDHARILDEARTTLGAARFEALRTEGAALDLDGILVAGLDAVGRGPPGAPVAVGAPADRGVPSGPVQAHTSGEDGGGPGLQEPRGKEPIAAGERQAREGGPAAGLRVRALGTFEVTVEGRMVDSEAWSYARPREVLLLLLLHPRGASRDEIGRALWPDATPPQAKNRFHVTLHHLRKRLERPDWIVLEGDRYRLTSERPVEWDGGVFEEGIRRELKRVRAGAGDAEGLRSVLALYRGDLLEGAGSSRWLEEARDRFRALYVDGRMALARLIEASGDPGSAADEYLAVTRQEELNEEAHRGLMRVWAAAGHRERAMRHFQRLEILLRETLESAPEEETRRTFRRISGEGAGASVEPDAGGSAVLL